MNTYLFMKIVDKFLTPDYKRHSKNELSEETFTQMKTSYLKYGFFPLIIYSVIMPILIIGFNFSHLIIFAITLSIPSAMGVAHAMNKLQTWFIMILSILNLILFIIYTLPVVNMIYQLKQILLK